MKNSIHFLNGKLVKEKGLLISPRDIGFSRGFAVFDFLRTYNKIPFKIDEHIDRLIHSAKSIGLLVPWKRDQIKSWVLKTIKANKAGEKYIKIMISGGVSDSMIPPKIPSIMIIVDDAYSFPPEIYQNGVGVITVKYSRYIPEAKSNNYIEGVKQTVYAKKLNAMEPVYYSDNQVYEGSNSNIFALINNELLTPKSNVLFGITRNTLLKILKLNIPVKEKNFTLNDLKKAKEIFMTGSIKEIIPVVRIDGKKVGNGVVGEITKEVTRQFKKHTLS